MSESHATRSRAAVDRGALIGAAIAGFFGAAWSVWGASGLGGVAAGTVRIVGIVIGIALVAGSIFLARRAVTGRPGSHPGGAGSMFRSRAYVITVILEVVILVLGNLVLRGLHRQQYIPVWVAVVVGLHFLVFARRFWSGFYWVGGALLAAAAAGLITGLAGGGDNGIVAVCGLISAVALLAASARTVLRARIATRR